MACGPEVRQGIPEPPWSLRLVKNKVVLKRVGGEMGFFTLKIIPFLISVILISHLPLLAFGAAITDIRFWSAPDHTRVVIDLTESVQYESSSQENPPQCQVELTGITSLPKKKELEVKDKYLLKISLTDLGKGKARLVLYQKTPLQANIFLFKPDLGKTHRPVIG